MMKVFKCRTFPKDKITFDYGNEHILITTVLESGTKTDICLNDKDIDNLIKYLTDKRS
jgi:hypothetical protein